jgi:hypothetical protein
VFFWIFQTFPKFFACRTWTGPVVALHQGLWLPSYATGCATSYRHRWDPLPPNEVSRIPQQVRKGQGVVEKTCCPWSHGLGPIKLSVSVAVPPAPVPVSSQRPLALSVGSVTSVANDKGNNEMILGAVYRSPGICLTAEENLS